MKPNYSRRQFLEISGTYGLKAALGATVLAGTTGILPGTDFLVSQARAKEGTHKIRFGAGIISKANEPHLATALYDFVDRAEKMSDGALEFQVIDAGQSCSEPTCGDRVLAGVIDMGNASPQNLGGVLPYTIAMDFPFLWQGREGYINFLYSKDSNAAYRDVIRNAYGIEPLWVSGEMRNIFLGMSFSGKDAITRPEDFANAKIRITNSVMIANFIKSIGAQPIPLAWTETLEGLKSGVVDGAETWPGAATGFGMHNVLSHDIPLEFCVGCEFFFMSSRTFNKLPTNLQEVILEASYEAMQLGYDAVETARNQFIGNGENPADDSAYKQVGIKLAQLSDEQLREYHDLADVEKNAETWSDARKMLDGVSGFDTFGTMKEAAATHNGKPHTPQRWWG